MYGEKRILIKSLFFFFLQGLRQQGTQQHRVQITPIPSKTFTQPQPGGPNLQRPRMIARQPNQHMPDVSQPPPNFSFNQPPPNLQVQQDASLMNLTVNVAFVNLNFFSPSNFCISAHCCNSTGLCFLSMLQ